ncbi:hypothetical protein Pmar_PMAR001992 [Perkinsus marinus ATCC 50983]|uniref:Uncharacterized protein n=1 Tax=Perkinsus marinus (strain ATCC 50983 / TXsc) TaxID=423536 RepID=C5LYD7_PERM5|nr:hypothetical protein Pmar_PMAR001992 [Perkinsus marinus ATCC 50983]EEQ98175.1 hypothetical protein Pmar_PMAR001992 [Perkinsus marinus ATCC 50983]|eukprot:XP_002765458.1 hypothetical protein Pmar_PMAR001992 [Perkinsus marinus ATCC 50983]
MLFRVLGATVGELRDSPHCGALQYQSWAHNELGLLLTSLRTYHRDILLFDSQMELKNEDAYAIMDSFIKRKSEFANTHGHAAPLWPVDEERIVAALGRSPADVVLKAVIRLTTETGARVQDLLRVLEPHVKPAHRHTKAWTVTKVGQLGKVKDMTAI